VDDVNKIIQGAPWFLIVDLAVKEMGQKGIIFQQPRLIHAGKQQQSPDFCATKQRFLAQAIQQKQK